MGKTDTVIFDWGGVLIDNPAQGLVDYCARHLGVNSKALEEVFGVCLSEFQKGQVTENKMWRNVARSLGVAGPKVLSLWGDAFRDVYSPKEEMFDLAKKLGANRYNVGFLSNTEMPPRDLFYEQGYDKIFRSPVFSCVERIAKPDPRIYRIVASRLGVRLEEAVFIDDSPSYIAGAKSTGMQGILFESPEQVKRELADLGINLRL